MIGDDSSVLIGLKDMVRSSLFSLKYEVLICESAQLLPMRASNLAVAELKLVVLLGDRSYLEREVCNAASLCRTLCEFL